MPSITVIISHYKKVGNLNLILQGLQRQSVADFEVIVSEDGEDEATASFITESRERWSFPLIHLTQEDKGFRKNKILNRSIQAATTDFLAFVDGDCIPHRHFVKEYLRVKDQHGIFYGRRVFLSEKLSKSLLEEEKFTGLNLFELVFSGSDKIKDHLYTAPFSLAFKTRGLKGCNWGVRKEDLLAVNGFDEDYINATAGEDDDISWRLQKIGLELKSMKNKAIVYHLHHPRTYGTEGTLINIKLMEEKMERGDPYCINGIVKQEINEDR